MTSSFLWWPFQSSSFGALIFFFLRLVYYGLWLYYNVYLLWRLTEAPESMVVHYSVYTVSLSACKMISETSSSKINLNSSEYPFLSAHTFYLNWQLKWNDTTSHKVSTNVSKCLKPSSYLLARWRCMSLLPAPVNRWKSQSELCKSKPLKCMSSEEKKKIEDLGSEKKYLQCNI